MKRGGRNPAAPTLTDSGTASGTASGYFPFTRSPNSSKITV